MSSDVHAKCTNSFDAESSFIPSNLSFNQYSTALTSWFVTRSFAFTPSASFTLKLVTTLSRKAFASGESAGSSGNCAEEANAWSHRTSTSTRAWIRPNSEKCCRRGSVWAAYLPSTGEMAVNGDSALSCFAAARWRT